MKHNVPENERNIHQFYTNTIGQTVTSSALAVDHECFEQHRSGMKRIYTPIRKRKCWFYQLQPISERGIIITEECIKFNLAAFWIYWIWEQFQYQIICLQGLILLLNVKTIHQVFSILAKRWCLRPISISIS